MQPALHLPRRSGHGRVGVVGEEADERGERAAAGIAGPVELEHPLHDVAHRVALGVRRRPEHSGEQLLGLALPELMIGLASGAATGKHLRRRDRAREPSGGS